MKRFVTYLYLYDGRMKGNNAGFIKVEINGEKSAFLVQIKNLGKYSGKGKVYLVYEAEAVIEAGELTVKNGEAREIYNVDTENVKDSGKTFLQVLGVKIELENADEKFLASCWTDNTEAVIGKPIKVQADLSNKKNPVSTSKPEPGCQKEIHSQNVDDSPSKLAFNCSKMYFLSSSEISGLFLTVEAYTPNSCSAASVKSPSTFLNLSAPTWHTGHSAGGFSPS